MNKKELIIALLDLIDKELEKYPDEICLLREEYYNHVDKIEQFIK